MHYHHESLLQYEARQCYQERVDAHHSLSCRPSYRVTTPDWYQDADNDDELKQLLDDAILCGFNDSQVTVETLPF
jgi:hypothetical protein